GNPIVRFPKRDDLHHMRHAAGDDESAEANEHPIEWQIAAFPDEKQKRGRNGEISGGDQKIRNEVEAHQPRIPQVTMAVRHKAVLAKETREKIHTNQNTSSAGQSNSCAGNASTPSSPDGFRGRKTNGTAIIALQPLFSQWFEIVSQIDSAHLP